MVGRGGKAGVGREWKVDKRFGWAGFGVRRAGSFLFGYLWDMFVRNFCMGRKEANNTIRFITRRSSNL